MKTIANKFCFKFTFGLLVVLSLFIQGCASTGNESLRKETESSVKQKIIVGKTTKDEVKNLFGSPYSTSFTDGGLEVWNYELSKMSNDAVDYVPLINIFGASQSGTKKQLVVLFDTNDVVKKCSMSESPVTVKTGLLNQ